MKASVYAIRFLVFLCALVPLASASSALAQEGYFRVEARNGIWWIIDPRGAPMLSVGMDHISYESDQIKGAASCPYAEALHQIYPDRNAWGLEALARIRLWGFNTVGAWSDPELWTHSVPYTVILDIAARAGANWQSGIPVDVYDPRFEKIAHDVAGEICQSRRFDRALLGYFSDNEMRWGGDWRGKETILDMYLKLSASAAGHQTAVEFLQEKYGRDIRKLDQAWSVGAAGFEDVQVAGTTDAYRSDAAEFLEKVATRYFEVSERAIHGADPNHLYLGARFAGEPPDAVLRAARNVDVVSINIYDFDPRPAVHAVFKVTSRPVLVGEFAFRAENSGLPNTHGAGPKVPDQMARAKAYTDYATRLESLPEAVGYHWFEWVDEPKEGRFDGEDSNYGVVDIRDRPYREFVEGVKKANAAALAVHRTAVGE
ncbi:MAG: beta-agarase [Terriglobia bacterium]